MTSVEQLTDHNQESLRAGTKQTRDEEALDDHRDRIGMEVLVPLVQFFIDGSNHHGMRRSASVQVLVEW